MTYYKIGYMAEIEPVEAIKVTEKTIVYALSNGRHCREHLVSTYACFFPTYEAAREHLIAKAELAKENAEERLAIANKSLARARAIPLAPPASETTR